jgi:hypothetical protein
LKLPKNHVHALSLFGLSMHESKVLFIYFWILKIFLKKLKFFYFKLIFLIFLNHINTLRSKIIFKITSSSSKVVHFTSKTNFRPNPLAYWSNCRQSSALLLYWLVWIRVSLQNKSCSGKKITQ